MATSGVDQTQLTPYQFEAKSRLDKALNECDRGVVEKLLKNLGDLNPFQVDQGWTSPSCSIKSSIWTVLRSGYGVLTLPFQFVYYFFRSATPQEEACQILLEKKVALDSVDLYGKGALLGELPKGPEVIRALAQAGAEPNIRTYSNYSTALHEIARAGDKAAVNAVLSSVGAANVNARDVNDMTPLHMAALTLNYPVFEALLEAGADFLAVDRFGRTPLLLSARYCSDCFDLLATKKVNFLGRDKQNAGIWHYLAANSQGGSVMRKLYEIGIPAKQLDLNGEGPLHYAARFGVPEVVGDLVYYGLDPNMLSKEGKAPIHLAAVEGKPNVIYKLAANGADVNLLDANQESPLHLAARTGSAECIGALAYNKAFIDKVDQYGRSPLVIALLNGQEEAAQKLADLGADLNLTPYNGHSPLYIALKQNLTGVADCLSKRGAVVKASKNGSLALHEAVAEGNIAEVNRLILRGYEFNQRDQDFQTALMIALMRGDLRIAQLLMNSANLNNLADLAHVLDSKNRMAIHYAAMQGDVSMVRQLLQVMTVSIPDVDLRLPLHYAAEKGHLLALIELAKQAKPEELDSEDVNGYSALNLAIMNKHVEVVRHLVNCGVDVLRVNQEGRAAIHYAAQAGNLEMVKLLLEKTPILINWKDHFGNTPLSYCEEGSDTQKFLISQGGKILVDGYDEIQMAIMQDDGKSLAMFSHEELNSSKNLPGGNTNLHFAVQVQSSEAAKVLMSAEESLVNYRNEEGDTPLILAARKGEISTLIGLLRHGADVNISNNEGLTVLHILARQGDLKVVKEVLLKHPNLNAYSEEGLTPLGAAISAKQDAVAILLSEMGAVIKTRTHIYDNESSIPFLNLILANKFKEVQDFLLAGVTDVADNSGRRALHYAVSLGVSPEMLTSLLNAGFDPNIPDKYGRTPLMLAVQNGNSQGAEILLHQNKHVSKERLQAMLKFAMEMTPPNMQIVEIIQQMLDNEQ